jgi:hypothetical protein
VSIIGGQLFISFKTKMIVKGTNKHSFSVHKLIEDLEPILESIKTTITENDWNYKDEVDILQSTNQKRNSELLLKNSNHFDGSESVPCTIEDFYNLAYLLLPQLKYSHLDSSIDVPVYCSDFALITRELTAKYDCLSQMEQFSLSPVLDSSEENIDALNKELLLLREINTIDINSKHKFTFL